MKDKISLLIADDHEVVRQGIRQLIGDHPRITVVAEAGDGAKAVARVREHQPDVALLDISMPILNGLQAADLIHASHPTTKVLIFSMYDKEAYAHQALAVNASGYLLKTSGGKELIEAIEKVSTGQFYFSPKVNADIIRSYLNPPKPKSLSQTGYDLLSEREQEIFRLVAEGLSSKKIGQLLFISPRTVDKHRSNIMKKLELTDARGILRYAINIGVLDPELWSSQPLQ